MPVLNPSAARKTQSWLAAILAALPGLAMGSGLSGPVISVVLPSPDIAAIEAADTLKTGPQPERVAVTLATQLSSSTHGAWAFSSGDIAVWQLALQSPGATTLSLKLDTAELPDTAEIVLSGKDGQVIVLQRQNGVAEVWTPAVAGDSLAVELRIPASEPERGELRIVEVHHGYRLLAKSLPYRSGSCNLDVACPAASEWGDETRAVARLVIQGMFLCTGTLVNNSAQDGQPLMLTAQHCVPDEASAQSLVAYWNYQASVCNGAPDGSLADHQSGASLIASSASQDFSLVQLSESPPAEYAVYFAGWDRGATVPDSAVTIHHPSGQEKRLSQTGQPLVPASQFMEETPGDGNFLMVRSWTVGTTEPGSSGAGLWNAGHRLVGQFSGGYSSCSVDSPDWFGRLAAAWDGSQDARAENKLAPHLDPLGLGSLTLDGMNADGTPGVFHKTAAVSSPQLAASPASAGGGGSLSRGWLLLTLLATLLRVRQHGSPSAGLARN